MRTDGHAPWAPRTEPSSKSTLGESPAAELRSTAGEIGEDGLIREGTRQGDWAILMQVTISVTRAATLRRHSRIVSNCRTGLAPERGARCMAAQGQQQPVGRGVEQQTELVGGRLPARGAVGSEVQFVRPGSPSLRVDH